MQWSSQRRRPQFTRISIDAGSSLAPLVLRARVLTWRRTVCRPTLTSLETVAMETPRSKSRPRHATGHQGQVSPPTCSLKRHHGDRDSALSKKISRALGATQMFWPPQQDGRSHRGNRRNRVPGAAASYRSAVNSDRRF